MRLFFPFLTLSEPASERRGNLAYVSALTQAAIVLALIGVTTFLLAQGRTVPPEQWTLTVAIVSYYLGRARPTLVQTNGGN